MPICICSLGLHRQRRQKVAVETHDLRPPQEHVVLSGIARNIKAKSRGSAMTNGSTMTNIRSSTLVSCLLSFVARVSCALAVAAPRLRISLSAKALEYGDAEGGIRAPTGVPLRRPRLNVRNPIRPACRSEVVFSEKRQCASLARCIPSRVFH